MMTTTHDHSRLWVAGCRVPSGAVAVDTADGPRRVVVGRRPGDGEIHIEDLMKRQLPGQRYPTVLELVDGSRLETELDPANALGRRGQRGFDPWKVPLERRASYVATVLASLPVGVPSMDDLVRDAIDVAFVLDSSRARMATLDHLAVDQGQLAGLVRGDEDPRVRAEALARITDPRVLMDLALEREAVNGPDGGDLRLVAAARIGRERHLEALVRRCTGDPARWPAAEAAIGQMCSLPRLDLLVGDAEQAGDATVLAALEARIGAVRTRGLHPSPLSGERAARILAALEAHVAANVPPGRVHDQARRRELRRAARRLAKTVTDPDVAAVLSGHPDPEVAGIFAARRNDGWSRLARAVQGVVDDLDDLAGGPLDAVNLPSLGGRAVERAARLVAEAAGPELLGAYASSSHPVLAGAARQQLARTGRPPSW